MRASVWCLIMRTVQMLLLLIIAVLVASGAGYCSTSQLKTLPDGTLDCQVLDVSMWGKAVDPVGNDLAKTRGQYAVLVIALLQFFFTGAMMWIRVSHGNSFKRLELIHCVMGILLMILFTVVEAWYGSGFGAKATIIVGWIAAAVLSFVGIFVFAVDAYFLLKAVHETRQATVQYYH